MSLSEQFQNMSINPGRRPPLSVDDLSDPRATPGRKQSERNTKNEQARFLVKAFEDFILPIVHEQGSGWGGNANSDIIATNRRTNANDNVDRTRLGRAAQQLVDALENFITSLISSEATHQKEALFRREEVSEIPEKAGLGPSVRSVIGRTQPRSLIMSKAPERPRLLTLALETARYRVFNKMPIRLLTFKSDGSSIKLLDRSDTWDHVSTFIEAGFDANQMNEDIKRRNYSVHNPGAEKEAIEHYISRYTGYAILSHTWLREKPGEVTYGDWNTVNIDTDSLGYHKLSTFCKVAAEEYGVTLAWMDTVCINKDSSAELDESIRSMYNWYRDASICITYLAQTTIFANMDKDSWFTRGWTLQELLAPRYIKFYDANWKKLTSDLQNDKQNYLIQTKISAATTITSVELNDPNIASVSRAMQWAANRQVTREEDTVYSLMGIFDVSLSIAYGEGAKRAFFRLVQQILNLPAGIDIVNWGYGPDLTHTGNITSVSSLIPSRPQQYLWRTPNINIWPVPSGSIPVTLTHLGLHLSVLVMPAISAGDPDLYPFHPIGDYYSTVTVDVAVDNLDPQKYFSSGQRYNVLDMASWHNNNTTLYRRHMILGVLNFSTTASSVSVMHTVNGSRVPCFAVVLSFDHSLFSNITEAAEAKQVIVIPTQTAISFNLESHQFTRGRFPFRIEILKQDLGKHGMQLLDMYL